MTSTDAYDPDTTPIRACTISRDVQNFDLLIEDMESLLGESWGDLGFADAIAFFNQPEAADLEFVALAIDAEDESSIAVLSELIKQAHTRKIRVILIADDISPTILHRLLREGADEFVPYPLPDAELRAAVERLRAPAPTQDPAPEPEQPAPAPAATPSAHDRQGVLMAVQALSGGTGATTLAVNLAWELAAMDSKKKTAPRVCLLDLDLQYGSVSTYLDLPRREAVFALLSDTEAMDDESFSQALMTFEDKLQVLTAPSDLLPLDFVTPEDVARIIEVARRNYDYVIVDMPSTVVQWTEAVLQEAQLFFSTLELDMRSAQNTLRLKRALKSEDLPFEKLRFVLNRAPKFTDISGKSRVKRLADSLEISIEIHLPDGGKAVTQCGDHGHPLALDAPKNPLRKEIAKLAASLHELGQSDAKAA
ncbi:MAG: pilus assembly protein CpaE [Sediminimonas qiaohouensis]|uniref:Pilus assembly protein CpaE n=1 Tax=Sediminimonas qiaohouensis TaxID=552061 RepID=A0A7C9HHB1_9RHOB|nr:AAA family ATPase [Sediminimonas qiaohouensis]MTJ03252.1 pilus assembly protein CpaE [Sediminimonas qiaohouensis]